MTSAFAGYPREWLHGKELTPVLAATTECCVLSRATLRRLDGFSPEFVAPELKSTDFMLKARVAGIPSYWLPTVEMVALDERSDDEGAYWFRNRLVVDQWSFGRKWQAYLAGSHHARTRLDPAARRCATRPPAAAAALAEDRPRMRQRPLRVLVISHGHPAFSMGGTEIASYNLFKGLNEIPGFESYYLARASSPVGRHRQSALMSLNRGAREILFNTQAYDYFRLSNRNAKELTRDFVRFVTDLSPDLVHFHHFIGLGMESLYALREALPALKIVVTFHEYLSICHNHGQMVKAGSSRLCYRASPAECAGCFPDISPAQFYKRERFIKTFLELADLYISPSEFLLDRYVEWGLPRDKFRVIENGIDTTVVAPPRPLPDGGGGAATASATSARSARSRACTWRSMRSRACRRRSGARMRASWSTAATSRASRRPSRRGSPSWSSAPATAPASTAATAPPTCRGSCATSTG